MLPILIIIIAPRYLPIYFIVVIIDFSAYLLQNCIYDFFSSVNKMLLTYNLKKMKWFQNLQTPMGIHDSTQNEFATLSIVLLKIILDIKRFEI